MTPFRKCECGCIFIPLGLPSTTFKGGTRALLLYACDSPGGDPFAFNYRDLDAGKEQKSVPTTDEEADQLIRQLGIRMSLGVQYAELLRGMKYAQEYGTKELRSSLGD